MFSAAPFLLSKTRLAASLYESFLTKQSRYLILRLADRRDKGKDFKIA